MSKKRLTALLLAAAVMISAFPASYVWAVEKNPQTEAEKEAKAEKRAEDKEKDGGTEEEEVASVEDANETIASYSDEEIEWEEVLCRYRLSAAILTGRDIPSADFRCINPSPMWDFLITHRKRR